MVKITFAAILAASIVAPALGAAISFDRLETRDVANTDSELFGRAVAEAFNDLYSREELSELVGRDIDEFTARDLEELMEREFDVDEEMISRDLLDVSEELDARAPFFSWIKKKLGFGKKEPAAEEVAARDFLDEEIIEARDSMADRDLEVRAPFFSWIKKKLGFGKKEPTAEEVAARDFEEEYLAARAEAAATPAAKQPNIIEKFLNLFRNKNHPGAKKAAAAKKAGAAAPAAPAAEAPAPEAPAAEAPAAREFDDEYLLERDYESAWEDAVERDFDEEMFERDYDEEMFERDYYEDMFEREYEFDELD